MFHGKTNEFTSIIFRKVNVSRLTLYQEMGYSISLQPSFKEK
ncbi:Uncharacterized protein BM_BM1112 [Brugia malayi]|uniref:Bm1112 n=1 Tax=Brugia malayi TaxID=6279 RepID=A0A0K0IQP6_BRUMA|nr:Uncharacterized protein BM_BM1112 [Brugia malayi]CDQ03294.1 Bm1112 [Brugia malayi]VIP00064.1 Uncharacterized protein BM_BM1112 [Brugia malayi]